MTIQELLAEAVSSSKGLLQRFLAGFTDENCLAQAESLPNHLLWTLGHVSLYLHHTAGRLDGQPLPRSDFGDTTCTDQQHFALPTVGFGSTPVGESALYPSLARGVAIFEAACDRLAGAIRRADAAVLEQRIDWMGTPMPMAQVVVRVLFHVGVHTGQIMDLRRTLGLERVLRP